MIANDSTEIPIVATTNTVTIGQKSYIIAITVFNALVTVAFVAVAAAIATKGWKGLPKWDYRDLKSVIASSSTGGKGIGKEAIAEYQTRGTTWVGDASDRVIGRLRMLLKIDNDLALVTTKKWGVTKRKKGR